MVLNVIICLIVVIELFFYSCGGLTIPIHGIGVKLIKTITLQMVAAVLFIIFVFFVFF